MLNRIKKRKHRAWPLRLGFFINKRSLSYLVTFQADCSYNIPGIDQLDTNKLFGLGYFWDIHKESARFGWRYCETIGSEKNKILLSAYCYVNGERKIIELAMVDLLQPVSLSLIIDPGKYRFIIDGQEMTAVEYTHRKTWAFRLNLYFGGNQAAPQTMHVDFKTL